LRVKRKVLGTVNKHSAIRIESGIRQKEAFALHPRLYPLPQETFDREIWLLIAAEMKRIGGRPPKIDHSACFCAMPKCRRRRSRGGICRGSASPGARYACGSRGGVRTVFCGRFFTNESKRNWFEWTLCLWTRRRRGASARMWGDAEKRG
jgi:hypothetical protein